MPLLGSKRLGVCGWLCAGLGVRGFLSECFWGTMSESAALRQREGVRTNETFSQLIGNGSLKGEKVQENPLPFSESATTLRKAPLLPTSVLGTQFRILEISVSWLRELLVFHLKELNGPVCSR